MTAISADRARRKRAREVENALASVRLEGLQPSPEAMTIFQRYIDGELSAEEMDRAFDLYLSRE
jgi:hypothetical protein